MNDSRTVWETERAENITAEKNLLCGLAARIIKSRPMSEGTSNTVYKLTTDNLQPVLINVLI